jgi:hypothetical protein
MAIKVAGPAQETGGPGLSRVIGPGGAAWWLSAAPEAADVFVVDRDEPKDLRHRDLGP